MRGADLKLNEYTDTEADDFVIGDLREQVVVRAVVDRKFDEVYQLAADMGGAGYVFLGVNDANVMHNSATISLSVIDACHKRNINRFFLFVIGLHLPRAQSAGSRYSRLRRG